MSIVPETEQWLLRGDCSVCRKRNYCSKPCRVRSNYEDAQFRKIMNSAMDEVTGGAFSAINKAVDRASTKYL